MLRILAEEPGDSRAEWPRRWLIAHLDTDHCATILRRGDETHLAGRRHHRAGQRTPGNQRARLVLRDLGVPFDSRIGGRRHLPMRAPVARHLYVFEMLHEAWQVLEVAPDPVEIIRRPPNGDGRL